MQRLLLRSYGGQRWDDELRAARTRCPIPAGVDGVVGEPSDARRELGTTNAAAAAAAAAATADATVDTTTVLVLVLLCLVLVLVLLMLLKLVLLGMMLLRLGLVLLKILLLTTVVMVLGQHWRHRVRVRDDLRGLWDRHRAWLL